MNSTRAPASVEPPAFRALVAEAAEIVGSQSKLARIINRSQQQVSALCLTAEYISAEDAMAIHWATAGKIPGSKLRPDLWRRPKDVPTKEEVDRLQKVAS